ncbi:MAG: hypothetical protein ABMA15_04185 [Vicinamibacterales bacterium]
MPSSFTGLIRTLAWSDFPTRKANPPGPGASRTAANTATDIPAVNVAFQPIKGTRPAKLGLVDNVHVSVTLDAKKSFVFSWVFSESQQVQDDLLNHEQGHYNLSALVARDFFVDLMLLKPQTFATGQGGINAYQKIYDHSLKKLAKIHKLYDDDVHPEQSSGKSRGPAQRIWDGYIATAFTQARSSGTQAPDGALHKTRLIEVLTQNQKSI